MTEQQKPTIQQAIYSQAKKSADNSNQIIEMVQKTPEGQTPLEMIQQLLETITHQQAEIITHQTHMLKTMLSMQADIEKLKK